VTTTLVVPTGLGLSVPDTLRLETALPFDDPVPGYEFKYLLDGTSSSLTRVGTYDFRKAKAYPRAMGSWQDGSQYYTANPDSDKVAIGTGPFSISAWVNTRSTAPDFNGTILASGIGQTSNNFRFAISNVGRIRFRVNNINILGAADDLFTGTWRHVAITFSGSGGTYTTYHDGVFDGSGVAPAYNLADTGSLRVGADTIGATLFTGGLNDIRFYGRAIEPVEVLKIYNNQGDFQVSQITTSVYMDASDVSPTNIVQSGGLTSDWKDKSGNVNHLTQGTVSEQPITESLDLNGQNVMDFAGSKDMAYDAPWVSGDVTVFQFIKMATSDTTANIYAGQTTGLSYIPLANDGSSSTEVIRINNTGVNGSALTVYADGVLSNVVDRNDIWDILVTNEYVISSVSGFSAPTDALSMGLSGAAAFDLNGSVAESIIMLTSDVTVAIRQKIEGLFAWKWIPTTSIGGSNPLLPVGHPYEKAPPLSEVAGPLSGFAVGFDSGFGT